MAREIITLYDMLRHTALRAIIACGITLLATPALIAMGFGTDPAALVDVGYVFKSGLLIAGVVSVLLAAGLTFRSAAVMRDLAVTRAQLLQLSRTDQLTGILNRRGFDELADEVLAKGGRAGVLMCDIDNFKGVNDRFGHEFGDQVLVAIADVFRAFAEDEHALVARHGGEEFVLLLTGPAASTIRYRAEFLRNRCATIVSANGHSTSVTVSIGYATADGCDLQSLMRSADEALYIAKRNGRNCVIGAKSHEPSKAA